MSVAGTRPLEPGFKLFVNAYRLEESARSCQLCRMMHRSLGAVPLTATIDDVVVSRDGTNLKVSERSRPVLRICAERESPGYQDIHVGLPTLPMAGSELHMSLMKEWLRSCKCGPPHAAPDGEGDAASEQMFRPTRVLDVGGPGSSELRLHCTPTAPGRHDYIALSHCWGKPTKEEWRKVCTHVENYEARCRHLALEDMPKTFRDAITVTWGLGKRFLWIDSLCIIQGDEDDWERESQLMEAIFNSAYCTISATSATGFDQGFLLPRPPRECVRLPNAPPEADPLWLCEVVDDFRTDVEDGPVNRRGWVFQERALSRRIIYFTENQTYFECGGGVRCETLSKFRK